MTGGGVGGGQSELWILHPGLHQQVQAQRVTGSTGGWKEGLHSWPLGVSKHLCYNTHTGAARPQKGGHEHRLWSVGLNPGLAISQNKDSEEGSAWCSVSSGVRHSTSVY